MTSVFISHSSKDKPFVRDLATFLEADGNITVWLDERQIKPGQNIVTRIAEGLDCNFILLVCSPDSVASAWVKEEWTDAFWEQTNDHQPKLAVILYRDCQIPRLLRNKKYFDLRTNCPQGFREIHAFLQTHQPTAPPRFNQLPIRPPLFIGRESELDTLRERLQQHGAVVPVIGMAGSGKTTLALEFTHRYQNDFEAVYWISCQSQSLSLISGELARLLGLKLEGELSQIIRDLKDLCARKRCLLILDNVENDFPGQLIPGGGASVLITTRQPSLPFLRFHKPVALPFFSEAQCFELFRQVLGTQEVDRHAAICKKLFRRVGHLPLGISVSAGLIRYDVHYTIARLAANLPGDVTALLGEAIESLGEASRRLLSAMAACAPEGFRFELAAAIAERDPEALIDALQQLVSRSLADELDRDARRYCLHTLVREAASDVAFAQKHSVAIHTQFQTWESNWHRAIEDLPDFWTALETAIANREGTGVSSLAQRLAHQGYALTYRTGRLADATEICQLLIRTAEERQDYIVLQAWLGNQAEILRLWGQLTDALALFKRQEAISLELDTKSNLTASYNGQALILWTWGRLDEALVLLKQQEAICLELDSMNDLTKSYVNQAGILFTLGRLEESLAFYQRGEVIAQDCGSKYNLLRIYDGQAAILHSWGRNGGSDRPTEARRSLMFGTRQ